MAVIATPSAYAAVLPPADPATGNGLYANCTSPELSYQLLCISYIAGATDVLVRLGITCRPYGVTYRQMMDIVVAKLKDDAISRHLASSALMMKYEAAAFPCHK